MMNISEKTIKLSIKDCIGIGIFVITVCITVGGINKEVNELKKTDDKIDAISKELSNTNMQLEKFITDRSNHRLLSR